MAIKIIKRVEPLPKDPLYRTECADCKSVLEFRQSDCSLSPDQRDEGTGHLKCPVCDHNNFIVFARAEQHNG